MRRWRIFPLAALLLLAILGLPACDDDDDDDHDGENETVISSFGETESHNEGEDCMLCHRDGGGGEGWFTVAGTVYETDGVTPYTDGAVVEIAHQLLLLGECARAEAAARARAAQAKQPGKPDQSSDQSKDKKEGEKKEDEKKDEKSEEEAPKTIQRPTDPKAEADPSELAPAPAKDEKVLFRFKGQKWEDMLEWLADWSQLTLDWIELPADYANITARHKYTVQDLGKRNPGVFKIGPALHVRLPASICGVISGMLHRDAHLCVCRYHYLIVVNRRTHASCSYSFRYSLIQLCR